MPKPDTLPAPPETLPELPEAPEHPQPPGRAAEARKCRRHACASRQANRPIKSFYWVVNGVPVKDYGEIGHADLPNAQIVTCDVDCPVTEVEVPEGARVAAVRVRVGPIEHYVPQRAPDGTGGIWDWALEDGVLTVRPELPPGAEVEVDLEDSDG